MFMALFVVYGFDTAGTFGEETLDASRQAPRGVLWSILDLGRSSARSSCSRVILAIPDIPRRDGRGPGWRLPDRDDDHRRP